ncbi:hypothetical protein HRbin40_00897 [bacterium HR40]|nr:hypothetical protein HRbin40_00897 [bacterium HR40]
MRVRWPWFGRVASGCATLSLLMGMAAGPLEAASTRGTLGVRVVVVSPCPGAALCGTLAPGGTAAGATSLPMSSLPLVVYTETHGTLVIRTLVF